ncbi:MAG: T9SS type A sorting domain-containing protein [Bacteroidales bacterium]|nr:T9SS type A sorting domain-containing protein [Bacteroidales bacterium]
MKPILYLTFFVVFSSTIYAQPNFTSSDIPYLDDRDSLQYLNYQVIDNDLSNETGNNYQWDFSWLPFSTYPNFIDTVAYREPQEPVSLTIPGATMEYVAYGVSGGRLDVYALRNDSLILYRQGTFTSGATFNPPVTDMVFPLAFGNQFNSYTEFFLINGGGQTVYTGDRNISASYDGYGSLTLPWGTYQEVFRMYKEVTDSSYVLGSKIIYKTYTWYKKGGFVPLLSIQYSGVDNLYFVYASKGSGLLPSSIAEINKNLVEVFPLPLLNSLQITGCRATSAKIYNLSGRLIREYPLLNNNKLDVSSLNRGFYVLFVKDEDQKTYTIKVVK